MKNDLLQLSHEEKTFIEASCTNNILHWRDFTAAILEGFLLFSDRVKTFLYNLVCVSLLYIYRHEKAKKYCL